MQDNENVHGFLNWHTIAGSQIRHGEEWHRDKSGLEEEHRLELLEHGITITLSMNTHI